MFDLVAFIDGGSLGNPGSAGVGVVIEGAERGKIRIGRWIGRQDNNMAEYVALLEALQSFEKLSAQDVDGTLNRAATMLPPDPTVSESG